MRISRGFRAGLLCAIVAVAACVLNIATAQVAVAKQSVAEKFAASKGLLDINTATSAQLIALPGMGPVYAKRVIEGRPYSAKNLLVRRGILPAGTYAGIKDLIIAHRVK
jgi:competence protein ComEA